MIYFQVKGLMKYYAAVIAVLLWIIRGQATLIKTCVRCSMEFGKEDVLDE